MRIPSVGRRHPQPLPFPGGWRVLIGPLGLAMVIALTLFVIEGPLFQG